MLRNSHCQVISSSLLALILCLGRLLEPDRLSKREIWSIERCQQFVVVLVAVTTRIGKEIGSKVRESGDLFFLCAVGRFGQETNKKRQERQ